MIVTAFGVMVRLKSNGTIIVIRAIRFPEEVCSVNQMLPPVSTTAEFGPEVVVGSAYSVNWFEGSGLTVVIRDGVTWVILGVLLVVL